MRELYAHFMVFYVPISLVVFALAYVAGWCNAKRDRKDVPTPPRTHDGCIGHIDQFGNYQRGRRP